MTKGDEISSKLEERHQKMTLLMRPIEDDADAEWKEVLDDYRKTRAERDLAVSELDSHIAFQRYIIEGNTEEEARKRLMRSSSHINPSSQVKFLGRNILNIVLYLSCLKTLGACCPTGLTWKISLAGMKMLKVIKLPEIFFHWLSSIILFFSNRRVVS